MKIHSTHFCKEAATRTVATYSRLVLFLGFAMVGTLAPQQVLGQFASDSDAGSVTNGLFVHGDESYQVVNTAAFRTAADVGETSGNAIRQVGLLKHASGSCDSCGTDSCGGSCGTLSLSAQSCGSCGTSCGGSCGRVSALSCNTFNDVCASCQPYRYVSVEAVYIEREDDSFTLSPNFGIEDYDFEWASRVTIGSVDDCVHGYELSFVGPLDWDVSGSDSSVAGNLGTVLTAGLPVPATDLSTFSNATFQSQRLEAEYYSVEASKTWVAGEVAKFLFGGRYINYDEDFLYFSQTAINGNGTLAAEAENKLLGLQVGLDLLFPVAKHVYSDTRFRAGGYVNIADTELSLINNGNSIITGNNEEEEFSGVFEFSSGVRSQLGDVLSLRAGVEVWYISGLATVAEQVPVVIAPNSANNIDTDDDLVFFGFSAGAELRF